MVLAQRRAAGDTCPVDSLIEQSYCLFKQQAQNLKFSRGRILVEKWGLEGSTKRLLAPLRRNGSEGCTCCGGVCGR